EQGDMPAGSVQIGATAFGVHYMYGGTGCLDLLAVIEDREAVPDAVILGDAIALASGQHPIGESPQLDGGKPLFDGPGRTGAAAVVIVVGNEDSLLGYAQHFRDGLGGIGDVVQDTELAD